MLLTLGLLWSAAVIAPGPNFLLAARAALVQGRIMGFKTSFGLACGAVAWGLAGFFGVHVLFAVAPWLYLSLKFGGSAYLIVLGFKFWRNSFRAQPVAAGSDPAPPSRSAIWRGFLTSVANPQTALSTASLFAATLPLRSSLLLGLGAVALMALIAIAWYGVVVAILTSRPAATLFGRGRRWIDRTAGLTFIGLGAKLAIEG